MAQSGPSRGERISRGPEPVTVTTRRYLPDAQFRGVGSKQTLDRVAKPTEQRLRVLAADRSPIAIGYGRCPIAARIANVVAFGDNFIVRAVWGYGPIDAIEQIYVDDQPLNVAATHYLGTGAHAPDATLQAALAAQNPPIAYADAPANIAYSVLTIPKAAAASIQRLVAVGRWRKVYDPRSTLTAWSENPALALADFLANSRYGAAYAVDYTSVATVANACDELIGTPAEKRRLIGLALEERQKLEDWIEALRTYAGCWVVMSGGTVKLVADRPTSTVALHFDHAANPPRMSGLKSLRKRGRLETPTMVRVWYTDTTAWPPKDRYVEVGISTDRVSDVRLPGVNRYSQANREAIERYNKLNLLDLTWTVQAFDDALPLEVGDRIRVTHPIGLTAKDGRVVSPPIASGPGRWEIPCEEYDAGVYSDLVQSVPSVGDTALPNPLYPPTVTGLTLIEELYQVDSYGAYASRMRASWTSSAWPLLAGYRVELYDNLGALIDTSTTEANVTTYASPAVREATQYMVKVYVRSSIAIGAAATASATSIGKQAPPGDVSAFTGRELGGEFFLEWAAAVDIDVRYYAIKWGTTSATWSTATTLNPQVYGLRFRGKGEIPPGTWRFFIKAIDSTGNESVNAAAVDVVVTSDSNSFLLDKLTFAAPTLTNMRAVDLRGAGTTYWVSDRGETLVSGNTYASGYQPYVAGGASGTAEWLSETKTLSGTVTGSWTLSANVTALLGTPESILELSIDNVNWTQYPTGVARAAARYVRVRIRGLTTTVFVVNAPPTVRCDALLRSEQGTLTTAASGGSLVLLGNEYAFAKAISATPRAAADRNAVYDRVLVAPATGLVLEHDVAGAGNEFLFHTINTGRTIAAGDYLEYDFWLDPANPDYNSVGSMDIEFSDATFASNAPVIDQLAQNIFATFRADAIGAWVHRKMSLTPVVGKTVAKWMLVNHTDVDGHYKAVYANIKVTDGAGTDRAAIFTTRGEPVSNTTAYNAGSTNIKCGPSNSFLLYCFNGSTQVANEVSWTLSGV